MSNDITQNTKEEQETETTKKICPVCGREWLYKLVTGGTGENRYCYHDSDADSNCPTIGEEDKYKIHLNKREKLVDRHNKGILPKSYYSQRFDKASGKMKPYLSPKKMMSSKGGLR